MHLFLFLSPLSTRCQLRRKAHTLRVVWGWWCHQQAVGGVVLVMLVAATVKLALLIVVREERA